MAQKQKAGHQPKLRRSAREANRNKAKYMPNVQRARRNHLKHAIKSCGIAFAMKLQQYYADHPAGKRH